MASERFSVFDLKLPQSPPTENKELYDQLQYLYRAIAILADTYETKTAEFISSLVLAGDNVEITTDLLVPSITISAPTEVLQDLIALFITEGSGINITYDDTANTLTVSVSLSNSTPATSGASGVAGTLVYDSSYLYVCVATDTWKRILYDPTPW